MTTAPDILADAAERCALADFPARARQYLIAAERMLSRRMRVPDMRTTATVTMTDTVGTLPSGFLSVSSVRNGTCLLQQTFSQDLTSRTFRLSAGEIHAMADELDLAYYQALPSLETNSTNWLSLLNPDLYATAIAYEALLKAGRPEEAGAMAAVVQDMIAEENRAGVRRGSGNAPMSLRRF